MFTPFGTTPPDRAEATDIAIDHAGRVYLAGLMKVGFYQDIAVARYLTNVAPRVGLSTETALYVENAGPLGVIPNITVADDDSPTLAGASVSIGTYVRGQDILGYDLPPNLTAEFDPDLGVLSFTGTAPPAVYEAVLRSVTYANTSDGPSELTRTLTITVEDGEQGDNLGSTTRPVVVRAVNDAPTFSDDGPLAPIRQDLLSPPGQNVSTVFRGRVRDPDPADFLSGIAVVGNAADPTAAGRWEYSVPGGLTWLPIGAVADDATTLALAASTRIRFLPVPGYSGDPTPLSARAIDSTYAGGFTADAGRVTLDPSPNGGMTPFSAAPADVVTTVFPAGTGGNTAPALSGVPVSANISEGQPLTFTAAAFDPDPGQALAFSLTSPPPGASIDPDTGAFAWTPTEAQGPDTFVFQVAVTDGFAVTERTVTAVVREVNTAPVLGAIADPPTAVRGSTVAFTATATDADLVYGLGNTLTYSLVNAPAGAAIDPDTGAFRWVPGGDVDAGTYAVTVRVADDGVPAASHTATVGIKVADATLTAGGNLLVGGTGGNDKLTVNPTRDKLGLVVALNGDALGTFPLTTVTGRLVAYSLGGNDRLTVNAKVTVGADLDGGSGNDTVTGGKGNDVLIGGAGKDTLAGGGGTNVLIGGAGADKLTGGTGDDLLIGGATAFDVDPTGLAAIRAEWVRATPYADRVTNLKAGGGLNGAVILGPGTVTDDAKDKLTGGKGLDWFVVSAPDTLDLKAGEQTLIV